MAGLAISQDGVSRAVLGYLGDSASLDVRP